MSTFAPIETTSIITMCRHKNPIGCLLKIDTVFFLSLPLDTRISYFEAIYTGL